MHVERMSFRRVLETLPHVTWPNCQEYNTVLTLTKPFAQDLSNDKSFCLSRLEHIFTLVKSFHLSWTSTIH